MGYIVVDTQEIVEKAHFGDLDYVKHALTLFTDLAAIFVRILVIMVSLIIEQSFLDSTRPPILFFMIFSLDKFFIDGIISYSFPAEEFIREN